MSITNGARAFVPPERRRWAEPDPEGLPRFAHHDRHVAAVMAEGGFVALSERCVGNALYVVCLPLIVPAQSPTEPAPPRKRLRLKGGSR